MLTRRNEHIQWDLDNDENARMRIRRNVHGVTVNCYLKLLCLPRSRENIHITLPALFEHFLIRHLCSDTRTSRCTGIQHTSIRNRRRQRLWLTWQYHLKTKAPLSPVHPCNTVCLYSFKTFCLLGVFNYYVVLLASYNKLINNATTYLCASQTSLQSHYIPFVAPLMFVPVISRSTTTLFPTLMLEITKPRVFYYM